MSTKYVGLVRVSTERQGESRLGLEAGYAALDHHIKATGGTLIATFEEVESGGHDDLVDRETLLKALRVCKRSGAILLVPRVDRLLRSVLCYADVKRFGVPVCNAESPNDDETMTGIKVVLSAYVREQIRKTTRNALAAYKAEKKISKRTKELYGGEENVPADVREATAGKLGAALLGCPLTDEQRKKGSITANANRAKEATDDNAHLIADMRAWRAEGLTLQAIADRLNDRGETTRTGAKWKTVQVMRTLDRAAKAE